MHRTPSIPHRRSSVWAQSAALSSIVLAGCSAPGDSVGVSSPERTLSVEQAATAPYNWLEYYGGPAHSGDNTSETTLAASNVAGLQRIFQVDLPGSVADGPPVVLTAATVNGTVHDVLFVNTMRGELVALDAHTGALLWTHSTSGASFFTNSQPAVDPSLAFVYAVGLDSAIHKYNVGNGSEVTGGGWPVSFTTKPTLEKGASNLAIATVGSVSYLYLTTSGFGDGGDYQGHVVTVNLSTGAAQIFNMLCSNSGSVLLGTNACPVVGPDGGSPPVGRAGMWNRAGIVFDAATNRIYGATGNGPFDGTSNWGDSIFALNPNGSGAGTGPVDSYTPSNAQSLWTNDLDLGSIAPVVLPTTGTKYPHLAVQGGKDQTLRLVNLDNLSGAGKPGQLGGQLFSLALPTDQGGEIDNGVPTWVNPADGSTWLFVPNWNSSSTQPGGLAAYKLVLDASGNPSLALQWKLTPAAPALIVGSGALVANNVLYYATKSTIFALDPTTGATLWSDGAISATHFQGPVVANGVLYVTDKSGQVTAYGFGGTETALSRAGWGTTGSPTNSQSGSAIDGNTATRWTTGTAQSPTANEWFVVNMQSKQTFDQITLDAAGSTNDYPRGYSVYVSNDGVTWGNPVVSGTGTSALVTIKLPTPYTAQYIKIAQTGATSWWWSIAELNVYLSQTHWPQPLSRAGWTVSTNGKGDGEAPTRAIDSDPDRTTRWTSGTPQGNPAGVYFEINLGAPHTFTQVKLDAADNTGDYPRGYQVLVSNDGSTWTSAATGTGTSQTVVIPVVFSTQTAQYVKIVQTGSAGNWWSITDLNLLN